MLKTLSLAALLSTALFSGDARADIFGWGGGATMTPGALMLAASTDACADAIGWGGGANLTPGALMLAASTDARADAIGWGGGATVTAPSISAEPAAGEAPSAPWAATIAAIVAGGFALVAGRRS